MQDKIRKIRRRLGTFTVIPGVELEGELRLKRGDTSLYIHSKQFFPTSGIRAEGVKGVLHDQTRVSLIDCIAPPAPNSSHSLEPDSLSYYAQVLPNFVVLVIAILARPTRR